jgi:hypothetical protein
VKSHVVFHGYSYFHLVRDVTVRVSLVEMGQNYFHFNRKQKSELVMIKPPMAENIDLGLNLLLVCDRRCLTSFVNEVTPVLRLTRAYYVKFIP